MKYDYLKFIRDNAKDLLKNSPLNEELASFVPENIHYNIENLNINHKTIILKSDNELDKTYIMPKNNSIEILHYTNIKNVELLVTEVIYKKKESAIL